MEDRKSIKKKYINKIKQLNEHNKLYYLKNKPKITDKEYDELKKNILDLEEKWYRMIDKEVGNKQFVVSDPDGYLLRFFEDLGERPI